MQGKGDTLAVKAVGLEGGENSFHGEPRVVDAAQQRTVFADGGEQCVWRKGYLGLESEGAPVDWRNLRIKELPSTGATAEQSAPVAEAK